MPAVSLKWFSFVGALEIPGCGVFPGFPQSSGHLLIWKAVTDFLRLQSISALAEILFLLVVQCSAEPHLQFSCVLSWAGPWASCHRRQSTKSGASTRTDCGNALLFSFSSRTPFCLVQARSFWQFLVWLGTESLGHLAWHPFSACRKSKLAPEGPQQEAGCSLEQRVVHPLSFHLCSGALSCEKKMSAGSDGKGVWPGHIPESTGWGTWQEEGRHDLKLLFE